MSISARVVSAGLIELIWPAVEDMIKLAVDKSNEELTMDDIYEKVRSEEMLLITITDDGVIIAVLTAEKREFPSGKVVLHICTAGGKDFTKWEDTLDRMTLDIARKNGCDEIYIIGRPGWKKTLASHGYNLVHTVLSKKVI